MAHYTPAPRFHDFDGLTRSEWKARFLPQWIAFQNSVNDGNRSRVRRLAMSHWHTWEDFQWVDKNIPNLTELDISDLQDVVVCDGDLPDGYRPSLDARGKLSLACHGYFDWATAQHFTLWKRLEKLWVRHWGCERLNDSRYRHIKAGHKYGKATPVDIRSRRESFLDEESHITAVIAACQQLRTLAIRGPSLDPALNRHWRPRQACLLEEGSHAHVCTIVKGLEVNAPESLRTIEFYQAEFPPQLVEMLLDRTQMKRFSVSFGDVLRRYAPVRELDIAKDDPSDHAIDNAQFLKYHLTSEDDDFEIQPFYEQASCRYHVSKDGEIDPHFHENLDTQTFPRKGLLDWLAANGTQAFLSDWARNPQRAAGPSHALSDADAQLAASLLVLPDREARPPPGLNALLTRLASALDACASLTTTDAPATINAVPLSFFSFIGPSPNSLTHHHHHHHAGIFNTVDAATTATSTRAFQRLHAAFGWTPLWDADPLVGPHFPWTAGIAPDDDDDDELDPGDRRRRRRRRRHPHGARVVAPIVSGLRTLAAAGVPVRLLVGNRPRVSAFAAAATGLYWGAAGVGEVGEEEEEVVVSASSWLVHPVEGTAGEEGPWTVAGCVDELVVRYQDWTGMVPGAGGAGEEEDEALLKGMLVREARGWQRFWRDVALAFTRLRRLWIRMPVLFDNFDSVRLATLLRSEVGRGTWAVRFLDIEKGERLEFVVREWVRRGGPKDVVFSGEELAYGEYQDIENDFVPGHSWWSEERNEEEKRRLWDAFLRAGKELQLPGWPSGQDEDFVHVQATPQDDYEGSRAIVKDDPGVLPASPYQQNPEAQLLRSQSPPSSVSFALPRPRPHAHPLTPISPPIVPVTPAETPPPLPVLEEEVFAQQITPRSQNQQARTVSPVPQTDSIRFKEEPKPSSTLRRSRKRKPATPKELDSSRRRTRSQKNDEPNEPQVENEQPPQKKGKKGKKSRWEKELEALKG